MTPTLMTSGAVIVTQGCEELEAAIATRTEMETDKNGILGCFRRKKAFVPDPLLEEIKLSLKSNMPKNKKNKRRLLKLFRNKPKKELGPTIRIFREPNMSRLYKHMVKELEILVRDIQVHEYMMQKALAKYMPEEKSNGDIIEKKNQQQPTHSNTKTPTKEVKENVTETDGNDSASDTDDDNETTEDEDVEESESDDEDEPEPDEAAGGEAVDDTEADRDAQPSRAYSGGLTDRPVTFSYTGQIVRMTHPTRDLLHMDTLDYLLYLRRRESGRRAHNAIDIDRLMYPSNADYPVSDYTRRYLDLQYYIPSLSKLCQATIKNIVCPLKTELKREGNVFNVSLHQTELPWFLKHSSLSPLLPPPVKHQIITILQQNGKYNRNNNHPITNEESHSSSGPTTTKSEWPSQRISETDNVTTSISDNKNNNHPVHDELEHTGYFTEQTVTKSKYPSAKSSKGEKASKQSIRKSKTLQRALTIQREKANKATDRYFLAPVGSISLQGLSPSKDVNKWMDIASIIYQGTYNHKNLDGSRYPKQSMHTTLPGCMMSSVMTKMKVYSIRPIKEPMTNMKTLLGVNESSRIFKETHAKFVCVNVLLALQFLHSHELFHGSICPAKILFNDKGYPCLTGFNSTEIIEDRQGRPRVRPPLEYSTPEQLYIEYITEQTDMFSLACVVYAMVYGRPPHAGPDVATTRRNIINKKFVPEFAPEEMSPEGRKFIFKCLKKKEYKRFSLLDLKKSLVESVPWFAKLNEEKLYRQSIPSPILHIINKA